MPKTKKILAKERPDVLKEWDYDKNATICSPDDVTVGSGKKVWWKCSVCGYEYYKAIVQVTSGHACKICGIKRIGVTNSSPLSKKNKNSKLVSDFPEIAKEWDYTKNNGLTPSDVTASSEKRIWWICPKGHSYDAIPGNRTRLKSGCSYCAGKKVLKGFNDLESQFPQVAKLWNYQKNAPLLPSEILAHSSKKKVWWICPKGHEWEATPNNLVNGENCPHCSSSLRTSLPEQAIFYYLSRVTEVQSRKQLFGWEVDVFLPEFSIAIEYDGIYFHSQSDVKEREVRKNKELVTNRITLLRIKEVFDSKADTDNVIFYNRTRHYKEYTNALERLVARINQLASTNFEIDIDFERDRTEILKTFKNHQKKNSIIITNPELEEQWNYKMNGDMLPEMFSKGSGEHVWWICHNKHEWKATIASRAAGAGCPYCSGFKWKSGERDLKTLFPEIAKEWDYEKNAPLRPENINSGSHKKVWWKCEKGHSYEAIILNRTNSSSHNGCPYCSNKKVLKGFNDLESQFPQIAKEWSYEKNGDLLPSEVVPGSYKEVWWKCSVCGNEYKKRVLYRTRKDSSCSRCRANGK